MEVSIIRILRIGLIAVLFMNQLFGQVNDSELLKRFMDLKNGKTWKLDFKDSMRKKWQKKWYLDGKKAKISQNRSGLNFWAGEVAGQDPYHAVLWTKAEFEGDLKIEYDYTRLDTATRFVNIIYIQATGSGQPPFERDIFKWNQLRDVPSMRTYFNNMHTYHISYAAYGNGKNKPAEDYIRLRRYLPDPGTLSGTEIPPSYKNTDLFKSGKKYHITIIKKSDDIFFYVEGGPDGSLYHWENEDLPGINSGRIGLRHMYTRGSKYSHFKVSSFYGAEKY
jgi:hypothetical protein